MVFMSFMCIFQLMPEVTILGIQWWFYQTGLEFALLGINEPLQGPHTSFFHLCIYIALTRVLQKKWGDWLSVATKWLCDKITGMARNQEEAGVRDISDTNNTGKVHCTCMNSRAAPLSYHILSKALVTPGLRPSYNHFTIQICENRTSITEKAHDWSQRS